MIRAAILTRIVHPISLPKITRYGRKWRDEINDACIRVSGTGIPGDQDGKRTSGCVPVARETLEEIDDALGQSLTRLMAEGPAEELTLTENAQPALMAVSMAVLVLEAEGGVDIADACAFVAGHSLGEYSALAAARSFGLADTARLLKTRGQAMQKAVPVGEGGMAALLGAELDQAQEIADAAAEGQICAPANDNAPGQVVLSGSMGAIDRAIKIAGERGIRRTVKLPVSAPFLRDDDACRQGDGKGARKGRVCQAAGPGDKRHRGGYGKSR